MGSAKRVAVVGRALALLACAATALAAVGRCRWRDPYLTCYSNPNYPLRNLSVVLTEAKPFPMISPPVPLPFVALPSVNLLQVMPWNSLITLLHRTFPETQYLYDCPVPILKSWQVDEMAGASWSPYRLTFEPCRLAPFFHTSVHSYVFGAVADLSSIGWWQLSQPDLADLRSFINKWSWLVGPHLGICLALNPCGGNNLFVGFKGFSSFVNFFVDCGHGDVSLQVRPTAYFWSYAMGINPPEWRSGAPPAWGVDPASWRPVDAIGWRKDVLSLSGTSATGSTFVQGELLGGPGVRGKNVLHMQGSKVVLDFGGQADMWAMVRSMQRIALSMRLDTAPDLLLWNRIELPLRALPDINSSIALRHVELTARASDCHLWITAVGQTTIPAHLFVRHVPALGGLIQKFYQDADVESTKTITAVYIHSHGNGVGVRLEFSACTAGYKLTPQAANIMRSTQLYTPFALTFKALQDTPAFSDAVTAEYSGKAYAVWFCKSGWDCPDHGASGVTCNTAVGVCNIAPAQASSAKSSSTAAAAADVAQTSAAEAAGPQQAAADAGAGTVVTDSPGRGSTAAAVAPAAGQHAPRPAAAAAPMPSAVAAAAAAPGQKLPTLNVTTDSYRPGLKMEIVQDECEDDEDCPRPGSRCMQDYQTSQFSCVRWK